MAKVDRQTVQSWIEADELEVYDCGECTGLHLPIWEAQEGVLECRLFVDDDTCQFVLEIALRPSSVLPLQGAVHFMNMDNVYAKVGLSMNDYDVPRLMISHAIPIKFLSQKAFVVWLHHLLAESDQLYQQLIEMEVVEIEEGLGDYAYDTQLH